MRATLKDLMDLMGVGYVLGPYETCPWSHYDGERGITCSAEVRMGPDGDEIEAEVQMMYDTPPDGKAPVEHICYARALPVAGDGGWTVKSVRLKGEPIDPEIYNWEEKACQFITAISRALLMEEIPDIDELIEEIFHSRERYNDQYGGGGGKSPKIRPAQLLDIKKGGAF